MQSSYTLTEAITAVQEDLAAQGTKFYTDSIVTRHLKNANRDLAKDLRFYAIYGTEPSVENQGEYAFPPCMFEITGLSYDGVYLPNRTNWWLQVRDREWRGDAAGTPGLFYVRGISVYGLYPIPDTADLTIRIDGYGIPSFPASGASYFQIPQAHEDLLILLACAHCARMDFEAAGAAASQMFLAEYQRKLALAREIVGAHEDTVVGEDATAHSISRPFHPMTTLDFGGTLTP